MKKYITVFVTIALGILPSAAQKKNEAFRLHIKKTAHPIVIDGYIDERAWRDAETAKDFFMVLPMDDRKANEHSEIRMTYDNEHLYLAAVFHKTSPSKYYVESMRRDFSFGKNDNFLLFLDPFNTQTSGFSFGSNAAGAQWDGTMFDGGRIDLNWDSKWVSKVRQEAEKWVFEMAIPFKSIRYKDGLTEWGINFSRLDLESSEKSSWTPIPRQFPTASLAYTGVLVWDASPPSPGTNISFIPYVLGGTGKASENGNTTTYQKKVGGDAKISLSSSMNLDLTLNPDFSQVEVDRQVTNLDRFELFFPEKRQFFLENADLFANFGYPSVRPFFSRRIGLGVPIRFGARLSGNLDEKWRLGAMDLQTAPIDEIGLPNQNFAVLSLQRKVFKRSSIGLMFVDKESLRYPQNTDSLRAVYHKFNRNVGLEYNLASSNNLWTGKAFFLKSYAPDKGGNGITQAAHLEYKSQKWNWRLQEQSVGKSYTAEVGFVPRKAYVNLSSFLAHTFFPKNEEGKLLSHGPKLESSYFLNENFERTDHQNALEYFLNFRNRSNLDVGFVDEYVELLAPFDPTRSNKDSLATGTKHHWKAVRLGYVSKPQSMFTYVVSGRYGGYYANGNRLNLSGELGYRFQPYVSLGGTISYNHLSLPAPWNKTAFWLIGSEVDVTFTNKLFFATLFQYNEQSKNFNLNSRFQWRYKPASDLFLVYTNNQILEEPNRGKSWSVTLKFNHWFNW